jgi:hypothetical protein
MKFVIDGLETVRDVVEASDQEQAVLQFKVKYPSCQKIVSVKTIDEFNKGGGNITKIKLSKSQWEQIGKTAGWMKSSQDATNLESAYFKGWDAKQEHKKGEWMMINPELRNSPNGRAFLRGWNDAAYGKPRQVPENLLEYVKSDEWIEIA